MKIYGSVTELFNAVFRQDGQTITFKPSANTYVGATNFALPPLTSGSGILVSEAGTQTLTGKSMSGSSNTFTNIPFSAIGTFSSSALAGQLTDETGTGLVVFNTSPTLVTPALGTPSAAVLTNATGLPVSTGISGLGTNVAAFLATPSSANLLAALTDETGTGAAVFATSPTLVTPALGTPSSVTLTNATGLPISTGVSGLATGAATFLTTPTSANLKALLTDETGSGAAVFATGPTLSTPVFSDVTVWTEIATPANPSAGSLRVYSKSGDVLATLNSAGVEKIVATTDVALSNPMSAVGDIIYGGTAGAATRLAPNITAVKQFLSETGTGSVGQAPSWTALAGTDVPAAAAATFGTVKGGTVPGQVLGTATGAGFLGEKITWVTPPASQASSTTLTDWTNSNIALTAGVWLIKADISCYYATGATNNDQGYIQVSITDASNNVIQQQEKRIFCKNTGTISNLVEGCLSFSLVETISVSTGYKIRVVHVNGAGTGSGMITNASGERSSFFGVRVG